MNPYLLGIVIYFLIGSTASFIVSLVDRIPVTGGLLMTTVFGISGAILGGVIANLLFGVNSIDYSSLIISGLLAFIFSVVHKLFFTTEYKEVVLDAGENLEDFVYYSQVSPLNDDNAIPVSLDKFLSSLNYPMSRSDIIHLAEQDNADEMTLSLLENLEEHIYDNKKQVKKSLRS